MSHPYVFVPGASLGFTLPDDIVDGGVAHFNAPLQVLGDYCAWLEAHDDTVIGLIPNWEQIVLGDALSNANARFTRGTDFKADWSQTDVTDAGELVFRVPILLATARELDTVRLAVYPDVGPRAALPTTMPGFVFGYRNLATGVDVTLATVTDASASVATYETCHWIEASGIGHAYAPVYGFRQYWIAISGEADAGANAVIGLCVGSLQLGSVAA